MANLINATRSYNSVTNNGAVTHSTSLNYCLDMFFLAGASRRMSETDITVVFERAYAQDPNLAAKRIMMSWCIDDKGRNVLYKQDGEERYPNFKLYKMIARTVHNHLPQDELKKDYFERFIVSKKKINRSIKIMNIDDLPSYM